MKLAVVIADAGAPPSAFVVWRGIDESIRKAAALGYHGVELALKTREDINADALAAVLDANKMQVSCISTGQVFAVLGLYFTHPDAAVRKEAVAVFAGLIHLAKHFGQTINVGRARGFVGEGQSRAQAEALCVDCMRQVCDVAGPLGVTILIEPVNRYEINFVNTLDEGAALLVKVQCPNSGLMPDVFHMNIEEARMGEALARHRQHIRYIHLADSNRRAPGQGHINFDEVLVQASGMAAVAWAAVEILPLPDPDTAARQAAEFLLPKMARTAGMPPASAGR